MIDEYDEEDGHGIIAYLGISVVAWAVVVLWGVS